MHPTELTYPCCLPALGEFSEMPPHGGLARSLGQAPDRAKAASRGRDFSAAPVTGNLLRGGFA